MSLALAGRAPATFEIKSATLPLVALLLKSNDMQRLARELGERFGDIPDFFDNDALVVDLTPLQAADAPDVDFPALLALLRQYRVMPVAVRGGSEAQMRAAHAAGLAAANEATLQGLRQAQPERGGVQPERGGAQSAGIGAELDWMQGQLERMQAQSARVTPEPVPRPAEPVVLMPQHAMIIDKPLRSGQQVYARGRDLVVMSMVNPGAEVIADGSIHVYAPLRGKAMAGAKGNAEARILTLCLEPELISIAGIYRTSEVALPPELHGKPAQVRLAGGADAGTLVMQPLPA